MLASFPFPFVVFGGVGAWRGQAGYTRAEISLFTKVLWICSEFPGVCKCGFVHVWGFGSTGPIEARCLASSLLQSPCSFVFLLFHVSLLLLLCIIFLSLIDKI